MWDSIKELIGGAAPLIGGLLGGPLGGQVGALVANKLGVKNDPESILAKLTTDPAALQKLKELEFEDQKHLRELTYKHAELEAKERMHSHQTTQKTIQVGDTAEDPYVRHTRPKMARMSFYAGTAYAILFELALLVGYGEGANEIVLGTLYGPAFTYLGMRTIDAFSKHKGPKMGNS